MKTSVITAVGFLLVTAIAVAQTPPDQLVRETTDIILRELKANKQAYERDPKKLYAMVQEKVLPHFDFRVMARSVLGRYWREATEEQRNRFIKEFRDLLVRTYATALLKYTNEEIRYLPFRANPGDKTVVVRTEVVQPGGPSIPIHYSFYRTDSGWKVYDIAIDGVSLVANYRNTYANKVKNESLDALINSLAESNRRGQVDVVAPGAATGTRPK